MGGIRNLKIWLVMLTFTFLGLTAGQAWGKYGGGSGTAEVPYLIYTADHFRAIGDHTEHMTSHFKLMEDIDLSGLPITIVHIGHPFRGTFDGNGKKIYNYRKEANSGFKGLFGWIYGYQSHAEIKNLTLVNPIMILEKDIGGGLLADDVSGDAAVVGCHVVNGHIESAMQSGDTTGGEVAGLVAWNEGTVVDCTVTGTIIGHGAGGLVSNNKGTIRNCSASVEVLANQSAGGLATYNYGIVERCSTTGKVESISTLEWLSIGGLVGSNHCYGEGGGGIISDCHSSSDITLNGKCGGGLVGISRGGMITKSYATGSVTGTSASYIGGLVGTIVTSTYYPYMGIIEYCYATGDVSGKNRVGGLVGESGSSIVRNCYATGAVSANNRVGGLMGVNYFYPYDGFGTAIIDKCYSTGQVTGSKKTGGLVGGYWPEPQIVTNSFWDTETSGKSSSTGGTGKTTAQMKTKSTFTAAGWDFVTPIWTIEDNDYPWLWWEKGPEPIIYYVDADATGNNDGSSWENACWCLQNALAAARYGDEIRVAEGMYRPDRKVVFGRIPIIVASGERTATFQLKSGVVIKGGYAGFSEPDPDARDVNEYETILSGDLNRDDEPNFANNGENSYHVVTGSGTDATAVLDGFTITAGNAYASDDYYDPNNNGGGVYNDCGSPRVINCRLEGNSASSNGGGMYNDSGSPTVVRCIFSRNSVNYSGGGMANDRSSNPTLTKCVLSKNCADAGGGMYNHYKSNPMLINCTFNENSASYGGGMYNNEIGSPAMTNCVFSGNSAKYKGGGMVNYYNSKPTLTNCTFKGNSAHFDCGGGIWSHQSSPTLTNCSFRGNSAYSHGGGVYNWGSSTSRLTNCVFAGNSANDGRALGCDFYKQNYRSTVRIKNCILRDGGREIFNGDDSDVQITYSDVQGSWEGEGNIDEDPLFVDPDNDDYHLLADSPCINAGDPNFIAGPNDTDIDGESRVMLGRVDMGADEFNPFKVEFDVVEKRRIGRTVFEYECEVTLENISRFAVNNIQLTLAEASENMTIIEPNVTFGDIEVGPGESARSIDTCTFSVDRSQAIDPAKIIWHSTCEMADTGQTIEQTASSLFSLGAEDIPGDLAVDGRVDFADLAKLAERWLWQGLEGSIPEDIVEDGAVNLADFAELAEKWRK